MRSSAYAMRPAPARFRTWPRERCDRARCADRELHVRGSPFMSDEVPVWVLLGRRAGDNSQVMSLARALGLPFEVLPLRFEGPKRDNVVPRASLSGLVNPQILPDYSPRLVLSIGRTSPPVARWIKRRSGGRTRLVHLGRPWGPTWGLDLVLSTAQYGLEPGEKVVRRLFPFVPLTDGEPMSPALAATFAALPRPWTVVLLGGKSKPHVFNVDAARALAKRCDELRSSDGGSLIVLPSPRTKPPSLEAVAAALGSSAYIHPAGAADNPYRALLHVADRFVITSDSAMMVAEVLAAGRPLELFELPRKPNKRHRRAMRWKQWIGGTTLGRRLFSWLFTAHRDVQEFHHALRSAGLLDDPQRAAEVMRQEQADSLARVHALLA